MPRSLLLLLYKLREWKKRGGIKIPAVPQIAIFFTTSARLCRKYKERTTRSITIRCCSAIWLLVMWQMLLIKIAYSFSLERFIHSFLKIPPKEFFFLRQIKLFGKGLNYEVWKRQFPERFIGAWMPRNLRNSFILKYKSS